jgi:hypothetical protein
MVQRSEQVNYFTSLLQWISNNPCQTQQSSSPSSPSSSSSSTSDKTDKNHANPRQHLMLSRQLKRHRRGEKRFGRNLPDCDQEEITQNYIELDVPLS